MRPTTAHIDAEFQSFLHPGTQYDHPRDVVSDQRLSLEEKRALLSSWASDASAIGSCPSVRVPAGLRSPVSIDEILETLCALDRDDATSRRQSVISNDRRSKPGQALGSAKVDIDSARIAAHRNNIARYRRLLRTHLTPLERDFIERRVSEEQRSLAALIARSPATSTPPRRAARTSELGHRQ
ncbi:hypothetical protein [Tardiphaga sp.]|uniref:hypothetical protein n=1 Tax=Tardiphaga sp. TaxID=1926292 RepID=UPI0037DA4914